MRSLADSSRPAIPLERLPVPEVIAVVEPFTAARPEEVEVLASASVRIRKTSGTVLVEEGAAAEGMFIVLRGRVNLVREGAGRDLILSSLGPGDVIGEGCAFDDTPMSTSAVTATPSELLHISADVVAAHVQRHPETLVRLMRLMSTKIRDIENVASSLALHDVEERLRRTLVRLAQRQGRRSPQSSGWILAPVPTQSELARMVGSCRETVSRTLSAMARNGLVSSSGRRMILDERLVSGGTEASAA
ncbi:MAG: Crp/Fnr family transcriptional regulator [Nannocystaceae bacterium]|nr:Crp/Fnr family transcriptional regulator [Nannocystaceae bacterium]